MESPLILKPNEKPSHINKDMVIGALIIPTLLGGGLVVAAIGALVGAVAGSFIGKKSMEHEAQHGKVISEHHNPMNKDTLGAGLTGLLGGKILAALMLTATGGMLTAPLALFALASVVGGGVVGALIGNKVNQNIHSKELEIAKKQTIVRHIEKHVSPETAKAVEYALEHNKEWANDITQKRMLEQAKTMQVIH